MSEPGAGNDFIGVPMTNSGGVCIGIGEVGVPFFLGSSRMVRMRVVKVSLVAESCRMMVMMISIAMVMRRGKKGQCQLWVDVNVIPSWVVMMQRADLRQTERPHESRNQDKNKTATEPLPLHAQ